MAIGAVGGQPASGLGVSPAEVQRLSRRTFSPTTDDSNQGPALNLWTEDRSSVDVAKR
jgi:hypothetical protein